MAGPQRGPQDEAGAHCLTVDCARRPGACAAVGGSTIGLRPPIVRAVQIRAWAATVLLVVLAGCGGSGDDQPRPAPRPTPVQTGTPVETGQARLTVPDDWRKAPAANQSGVSGGLGILPGGSGSVWVPQGRGDGGDSDTAMVIVSNDLAGLGATSGPRLETPAGTRSFATGARTALRRQGIRGVRFVRRPSVDVGGSPAMLLDSYIPDPTGGQVLVRVLGVQRGTSVYLVEVNGPTTDGPRIRSIVERLRSTWQWASCRPQAAANRCRAA